MKLYLCELQKQLTDKLVWGVLAFLLLINTAFCYYFTDTRQGLDILPAMKAADEAYQNDPEGVLAAYHLYQDERETYDAALEAWIDSQVGGHDPSTIIEEPIEPNIPSTYCEGWNDYDLLDTYFQHIISENEYRIELGEAISISERTLRSYQMNGNSPNSYAYRYQLRYMDEYNDTLNRVKITEHYAYGWDILFVYSGTGLFIFLAAIFMGSRLFMTERDCGMHLILRTTYHGRDRQAAVKIVSALLLTILITLLFTLSSMAVIGWKVGFSSPWGAVQQISSMLYCPYPLSMITCLLWTVGCTVLAVYSICLLTAVVSLIVRRSLAAILISVVVVGLSYYLFGYGNPDFSKYVNIFTAVSVETLLGQWRAVHVGEYPVSQLVPLILLLISLLSVAVMVGILVWSTWGIGVSSSSTGRLSKKLAKIIEKLPRLNIYSLRIATYERQKLLPYKRTILCLMLVALKMLFSFTSINGELTYTDELKLLYMKQYKELTLSQSYEAVDEQVAYYDEISSNTYVNAMATKRVTGEISREEYYAYRNELNEARTYQKSLESYRDELQYLLDKETQTGITAKPVFSTGVRVLLESDFEWILAVLFLLLFSGSYAREYESNFMPLLRSTKWGRFRVFLTKGGWVLAISLLLSLSFTLLDMGLVFARYDMSCTTAPLFAISTYRNTASDLTVGEYLVGLAVLRTFSYMLFGALIAALSGTLCSEWSAAGVILLCCIPYVLKGIGLDGFEPFDFTLALSGDRLYLYSTALGNTGSLWFLGIFITAWVVVNAVLIIVSHRKFCK